MYLKFISEKLDLILIKIINDFRLDLNEEC